MPEGSVRIEKNKNLVAVDLGAGSCRIFSAKFNGSKIDTSEIYRFQNNAYLKNGTLFWDFANMMRQIKKGLDRISSGAEQLIDSIGVDGWGCDFGLLDKYGKLMQDPVSYRDSRTEGIDKQFYSLIPEHELFEMTSSKTYGYNTLFQLYYVFRNEPELSSRIKKVLPVASLVNYFLTGREVADPSILSGSQLFNVKEKKYLRSVLDIAGIPGDILPEIKDNGTLIGKPLKDDLLSGRVKKNISGVSLVCCMDSCSAVMGIPVKQTPCNVYFKPDSAEPDFVETISGNSRSLKPGPLNSDSSGSLFINSGTWSLIGMESKLPIVSEDIFKSDFTNWCSFRDNYAFIKSFNGFYYLQLLRKQWEKQTGRILDYDLLKKELVPEGEAVALIDMDDEKIHNHSADFLSNLENYFKKTLQKIPASRASFLSSIFQSLVLEYFFAYRQLVSLTGCGFNSIYMAGGGSINKTFCQWVSDCLGMEVYTGFAEASVNGNIVAQLIALGEISNIREARDVIRNSSGIRVYTPSEKSAQDWEKLKQKYNSLKHMRE